MNHADHTLRPNGRALTRLAVSATLHRWLIGRSGHAVVHQLHGHAGAAHDAVVDRRLHHEH
jgi:hypothetical protein